MFRPDWLIRLFGRAAAPSALAPVFATKVVLDTNIYLEGKPLGELPWPELQAKEPFLILLTPQGLKEIDSKKRDGRLGKIARSVNRLIGPAVGGGTDVALRNEAPKVSLGLALCNRIDWGSVDDLREDDGDSRLVAETLHLRGVEKENVLFVSHDINPINMAARHGLRTFHVGDTWLRPAEPGPVDRENQRLKQRLAAFEANEPAFKIEFAEVPQSPARVFKVAPLDKGDVAHVVDLFLVGHPPKDQDYGYGILRNPLRDSTYEDRYSKYRQEAVPRFAEVYHEKLELLYGQFPFTVRISNTGTVQAENVLVEITSSEGWLHDKYVFVSPSGPKAPKLRDVLNPLSGYRLPHIPGAVPTDRHEFTFAGDQERTIEARCQDLRHGKDWQFDGIVCLDPNHTAPAVIEVRVTATNLHGEVTERFTLEKDVRTVAWDELIDRANCRPLVPLPMARVIDEVVKSNDPSLLKWLDGDEED